MLFINRLQALFPDAKLPKDISQDFVGGDWAGDGADVVNGFTDVLGNQIGGDAEFESFLDTVQSLWGLLKGFVVAQVCH